MTFTVTPLINGGYLVEGTDARGYEGSTILHSESWDAVLHLNAHEMAQADFDAVVKEFFAPLTEAADVARKLVAGPSQDWGKVTIGENVEGRQAETVQLNADGIILRLLDNKQDDLLRWVDGGRLLVAIQA